jgi:hypothetical protein
MFPLPPPRPLLLLPEAGGAEPDKPTTTGDSVSAGIAITCVLATRVVASSYRRRIISFSSAAGMYSGFTPLEGLKMLDDPPAYVEPVCEVVPCCGIAGASEPTSGWPPVDPSPLAVLSTLSRAS